MFGLILIAIIPFIVTGLYCITRKTPSSPYTGDDYKPITRDKKHSTLAYGRVPTAY